MVVCTLLEQREVFSFVSPNALDFSNSFLFPQYHLPTVEVPQTDSTAFRSISADTLSGLLDLPEAEFHERYILIDCRYPYEYNGGHIKYAINFHESRRIHELFYPDDDDEHIKISKRIPIFYCEFSQVRGPNM